MVTYLYSYASIYMETLSVWKRIPYAYGESVHVSGKVYKKEKKKKYIYFFANSIFKLERFPRELAWSTKILVSIL